MNSITLEAPVTAAAPNAALDWRRLLAGHWTAPEPMTARLRIHAFGPLRIELDGQALQIPGKAPRKPLDLLALLVAQGCRPLDVGTVMDELWPSLDAEAPRASLDMAVLRLRKLLGMPSAVRVCEGRLSLDPQRVWTDVAAFESLCEAAADGHQRAPWQAMALYTDALLGTGPIGARLLARRQCLAQRLCDLAVDGAGRLLACGAHAQAQRLLQRALDCEPLCEPLYRALMQAQLAQGERAEALRTFKRCSDLLLAGFGTPPGAATLGLIAPLR